MQYLQPYQAPPCKKIKPEEQTQRSLLQVKPQTRKEKPIHEQKDRISLLRQPHQSKKQLVTPPKRTSIEITVPHSKTDEETTTISSTWGILYRDLEPRQQLYANKAITEVLYQGALGKLHEYSYKGIESPAINTDEEENPLGTTIDRINYNDSEYQQATRDQITNIYEALNYLKPLEEYALRENHAAIGLISQLEETLRTAADELMRFA